jgi:hypothetical protein
MAACPLVLCPSTARHVDPTGSNVASRRSVGAETVAALRSEQIARLPRRRSFKGQNSDSDAPMAPAGLRVENGASCNVVASKSYDVK